MPIKTLRGFAFSRSDFALDGESADSFIDAALAGTLYFNAHSDAHPAGEVRGQLSVSSDDRDPNGLGRLQLEAALDGAQEVPPVDTKGRGTGTVEIVVSEDGLTVTAEIRVQAVQLAELTLLHIHDAPAGSNGGVVLNLDPDNALASDDTAAERDAGFTRARDRFGTSEDDEIRGSGADDAINARRGDDTVAGRNGDDLINGQRGDDDLRGNAGTDTLNGGSGDDRLAGGRDADILTTGGGADTLVYRGDPFEGGEVDRTDAVRSIVGNEDTVTDFDFEQDEIVINVAATSIRDQAQFAALDATDPDAQVPEGANVIVLLNADNDGDPATPFLAGTAANQIADLVEEDGAGYFVYFNSVLGLNRLVYSDNLADATADLKIIARFTESVDDDAIAALGDWTAETVRFAGTTAPLPDVDDAPLDLEVVTALVAGDEGYLV